MAIYVVGGLYSLNCINTALCGIKKGILARSPFSQIVEDTALQKLNTFASTTAKSMGITKEIQLLSSTQALDFYAFGNNILPGKATVILPDQYQSINEDATKFFITHELAHIKSNDPLTIPCISLIVSIACTLLLFPLTPIGACLVGIGISAASEFLITRWREKQADIIALSYSSPEMKQAAKEHFETLEQNLPSWWSPHLTFKQKQYLLFLPLTHPSFNTRISMIQDSITSSSPHPSSV